MYSALIIDRTLHRLQKQGITFKRRSIDESLNISGKLETVATSGKDGKPSRNFTEPEKEFMRSEALLCRADFRYAAERYLFAEMDAQEGGGIGPARFWESQERTFALIAKREEECWQEWDKYRFCEGIRLVWHKTRQQGATAFMCLLNGHRMVFYKHTRSIAASLDEDKVHAL